MRPRLVAVLTIAAVAGGLISLPGITGNGPPAAVLLAGMGLLPIIAYSIHACRKDSSDLAND